jgi:hypothetical protein
MGICNSIVYPHWNRGPCLSVYTTLVKGSSSVSVSCSHLLAVDVHLLLAVRYKNKNPLAKGLQYTVFNKTTDGEMRMGQVIFFRQGV